MFSKLILSDKKKITLDLVGRGGFGNESSKHKKWENLHTWMKFTLKKN